MPALVRLGKAQFEHNESDSPPIPDSMRAGFLTSAVKARRIDLQMMDVTTTRASKRSAATPGMQRSSRAMRARACSDRTPRSGEPCRRALAGNTGKLVPNIRGASPVCFVTWVLARRGKAVENGWPRKAARPRISKANSGA